MSGARCSLLDSCVAALRPEFAQAVGERAACGVVARGTKTYLSGMTSKKAIASTVVEEWTLPSGATLGSSVRAKGILHEIRSHLPSALRKSLEIRGGLLVLSMPDAAVADVRSLAAAVSKALDGIERRSVIPREIEDILTISTTERHRWLKDGRLKSAGTRTVKLRGRAKKVTFHVFDPHHVEDVLNRDLVAAWREDDAERAAKNRQHAAEARALKRRQTSGNKVIRPADESPEEAARHKLKGWAEFERDGLLR